MTNALPKAPAHARLPSSNPLPANEALHDPATPRSLSLDERLARSREHLRAIRETWSDLRAQTTEARRLSSGKVAARMIEPLRALFRLAATPTWAPVFAALGVGHDTEQHHPFDPSQLLARAERYEALQALHAELLELTSLVADDLLHHGARIVSAGKPAISLARTLSQNNPIFRAQVAPILNELNAMVSHARKTPNDPADPVAPAPPTPTP